MGKSFKSAFFYIIYSIGTLLVLPFFIGWKLHAANDLLWEIAEPAYNADNIIKAGVNKDSVWANTIRWTYEVDNEWITKKSMILKITRLLLILTIALSVTMILYNGMMYIVQTWQWKEWKSLIKNVLLIVVGILVSLFSVVIINLIQSIPNSIDEDLKSDWFDADNKVLEPAATSWKEIWKKIFGDDDHEFGENQKQELIDLAKNYFITEWIEPFWDGENWIWMVHLGWHDVEMLQAYSEAMDL